VSTLSGLAEVRLRRRSPRGFRQLARGVVAVPSGDQPLLRAQNPLLAVLTPPKPSTRARRGQVVTVSVVQTTESVATSRDPGPRGATRLVAAARPRLDRLGTREHERNWHAVEGSIACRHRPESSTPSLIEAALWRPLSLRGEDRSAPRAMPLRSSGAVAGPTRKSFNSSVKPDRVLDPCGVSQGSAVHPPRGVEEPTS